MSAVPGSLRPVRRIVLGPFSVEVAETRSERMRGLLGRQGLLPGHAMLFQEARSVHTFAMRFPIVVAYLDRGFRVLEVRLVRPNRLAANRRARHVLELGPDEQVRVGEVLIPRGLGRRTTPDAHDAGRRERT